MGLIPANDQLPVYDIVIYSIESCFPLSGKHWSFSRVDPCECIL